MKYNKIFQETTTSSSVKSSTTIESKQTADTLGSIPGLDNPISSIVIIVILLLSSLFSVYKMVSK